MKTPQDRLSEFDEKFPGDKHHAIKIQNPAPSELILSAIGKLSHQSSQRHEIKHHLVQTILSVLQEQAKVVQDMKKEFLEEDPENIQDKEAYYGNLALSDYKQRLEETIKEWEKMV